MGVPSGRMEWHINTFIMAQYNQDETWSDNNNREYKDKKIFYLHGWVIVVSVDGHGCGNLNITVQHPVQARCKSNRMSSLPSLLIII